MRSIFLWAAFSTVLLSAADTAVKPAEPAKSAPKYQDGSCCDKAAKKDANCNHPCCVKAEKAGTVCVKCNDNPKK